MSIEKTEAIVLRAVNYRDSSKIVTFYTKRYGKMSAIAKGARNPKSKFGSLFQPLNYLQIVFYRRESRELQYVSSSDFVRYFKSLTSDVDRFSIAMSLIEIINRVMHDEEENEAVFTLLADSLGALDGPDTFPRNTFAHFGLNLAIALGFTPNFAECLHCSEPIDLEKDRKVYYVVEKGGPVCEKCTSVLSEGLHSAGAFEISAPALLILRSFTRLTPAAAARAQMEQALRNEISNFVFIYLKKHSGTLKEIKALKFLATSQYDWPGKE